MTKVFVCLLAGLFAVSAFACDGSNKKEGGTKKPSEAVTQIKK